MFIDIHCHLTFSEFDEDRNRIINSFKEERISFMINPGTTADQSKKSVQFAQENENIYANIGIHPCEAKEEMLEQNMNVLESLVKEKKVVGIGEIGFDYHHDDNPSSSSQEKYFKEQIRLAKRNKLPIVIHTRDAWDDTFRVIGEEQDGTLRGVFHCFSGGTNEAKKIIDMGFFISIPGIVTFKNSSLVQVVENVPLEYVVTETDAPYLSPMPYRGKRNDPIKVKYVTEKIAEIKKLSIEETASTILCNAKRLFNLN